MIIPVVTGDSDPAAVEDLLGKGLNGPSLPLDVGQTDDIPVHLRRLVALRDQKCQVRSPAGQIIRSHSPPPRPG
jgi:hypothetical protein